MQPSNAATPISVTKSGITKSPLKPEHPLKALLPILVTEFPIFNAIKLVQPLNAKSPISVTESGIINSPVNPLKLENA